MYAFLPALCRVGAALLALALLLPQGSRAEETIVVTLDRARIVKLPDRTQTLVIGNPIMARPAKAAATPRQVLPGPA